MDNKEKLAILKDTYKQNNEALVQMEIHGRYLNDLLKKAEEDTAKDPQQKPRVTNINNAILDLEENRSKARAHQVIVLGMQMEIEKESKKSKVK